MRPRVAPSAARTASSRPRRAERISSRLATFAHEISTRKTPTEMKAIQAGWVIGLLKRSLIGWTNARMPALVSGNSRASRATAAANSSCA